MSSQVAELPVRAEARFRMTFEEFLAFAADRHAEWVDGEVTVFLPNSRVHQHLFLFLGTLLAWFARRSDLGTVLQAPFAMRVPELRWWREPDILFIAARHLDRLDDTRLLGPADLAVELISDESVESDTRTKRLAYQEAGVPEYWLLDPRPGHQRATFFQIDDAGVFREQPLDARGRYHPRALPGFWLDPAWLWQDPLPDPDDLKPLILRQPADAND